MPLAKGLLGEEAAALIGSLVVARVWQAVQRRAGLAPADRPVTFAYIDEFQDYLKLPMSVADVLAQARGLGLGLTLAHQHLGQLPNALQDAVLANARSRVIFQVSAGDARTLARELTPYLGAEDLQGLNAYEVAVTLSAGARIAPPATGRTLLPPVSTGQADAGGNAPASATAETATKWKAPSEHGMRAGRLQAASAAGRCTDDDDTSPRYAGRVANAGALPQARSPFRHECADDSHH